MSNTDRFKYFQPNAKDIDNHRGDCVIRALCKITGKSWLEVSSALVDMAIKMQAMPNSSEVYARYLEDLGYKWVGLKAEKGSKRPTVKTFHKIVPNGACVLRTAKHVVAMIDGYYYDTWNSGNRSVYGYYIKC